ncbi:MAG: hypothetical protein IPJ77_07805 [Planctomycetes bacterium]|nr:hypothetical protein [Planctomycetota bacterium]
MTIPRLAHVYGPHGGPVLFVAQRARDGWIAFDLAGPTTDEARDPGGERLVVTAGGPEHADRIFAVHDRLDEVALGRALAVGEPHGARFGFGGDFLELWRGARHELAPGLRFFRGLTVLRAGDARFERGAPASAALLFATPRELVRSEFERAFEEAEARRTRLAVLVRDAVATSPVVSRAARRRTVHRGR